jgi:hypothetical protein
VQPQGALQEAAVGAIIFALELGCWCRSCTGVPLQGAAARRCCQIAIALWSLLAAPAAKCHYCRVAVQGAVVRALFALWSWLPLQGATATKVLFVL